MLHLFISQTRSTSDHDDAITSRGPFRTFRAVDSLPRVPSIEATYTAVFAQSGALAAFLDWPVVSAVFLIIGSALLVRSLNNPTPAIETQSRNFVAFARRALLLVAFAILFILAGLILYVRTGGGGDKDRAKETTGLLDCSYKGAILLTDPIKHEVFVPRRTSTGHNLFTRKMSKPVSVPFSGVYWFFRWPQSQPPPGSYISRDSPLTSGFRSTDRFPLSMEAHQNFGTLIDLACCSKIQLAVKSADASATLNLILTNTTVPGRPSLFLGQVAISSKLDRRPDGHVPPKEIVLSFEVPHSPKIREFDEATIFFNRAYASASARVAIDRFIFVPRGF